MIDTPRKGSNPPPSYTRPAAPPNPPMPALLCPVSPAKSEESGSSTGLQSLLLALVDSQILLAARIEAQTEAIDKLADSVYGMINALAESAGEDIPPTTYMDGSPIR